MCVNNRASTAQSSLVAYLEQLKAFVGRSQALYVGPFPEQKLVDLLADDERRALHPFVRYIRPAFLDTMIQQSSLFWFR